MSANPPLSGDEPTCGERAATAAFGGVEMWRGGFRLHISVAASFVWRCLSVAAVTPFPHPALRTGRASPASGSRTRPHAFTHGTSRPDKEPRDADRRLQPKSEGS